MKARNRPPRLESRVGVQTPAPPPTVEQRLARAKVAGRGLVGPTELRHLVERLAGGDPSVFGIVTPIPADVAAVWDAVRAVYGAGPDHPEIDPEVVVGSARRAAEMIAAASTAQAKIAFATSSPASMLPLHCALVRRARSAGAEILDDGDIGPVRIDGRSPRWVRFVDGVAVVTDGHSLLGATGPDAPNEWLFQLPRPVLVVADGPFADAAYEAGLAVISFAGLDRPALAIPAATTSTCIVVPAHGGRPPRAYQPLVEVLEAEFGVATSSEM